MKIDVNAGIIAKKPASSFGVGDIIMLQPNERAPADLILIHTKDKEGQVFIRTDQLDGETDWKLRLAVTSTQKKTPVSLSFFNLLD